MKLNLLLNRGIQEILRTALTFNLSNPDIRAMMLRIATAFRRDMRIRARQEQGGTHIPPFLIASIASECNLHCAGCYARANGACGSSASAAQMSADEWRRLFAQADDLGVSIVLLAGGEPLLRQDVLEVAADFPEMLFPVFTNGTLFSQPMLDFFAAHRHLIPVLSAEGDSEQTDARRGQGVSQTVAEAAAHLRERGILHGVSLTVTTENLESVTDPAYIAELRRSGCNVAFFVEYVPAEPGTESLILTPADRAALLGRIEHLRRRVGGMSLIAFPGDEAEMGGCLAAGRGFFHISPSGDAEACPFSPFATLNLRSASLLDALRSPFFEQVRAISASGGHGPGGGCTLFALQSAVEVAQREAQGAP